MINQNNQRIAELANENTYIIYLEDIFTAGSSATTISQELYNEIINALNEDKVIILKPREDGGSYIVYDYQYLSYWNKIGTTTYLYFNGSTNSFWVYGLNQDLTVTNEIRKIALEDDVLTKDNTTTYTPISDYNPATKKYVDDNSNKYIYNSLDGYELYESEDVTDPTLINRIFDIVNECTQVSNNKTIKVIDYYNAVYSVGDVYWKDNNTLRVIYRDFNNYNNIRYIDITRHDNANSTINFNGYVQRILTESEYQALGDTVNSDGVLYFITED